MKEEVVSLVFFYWDGPTMELDAGEQNELSPQAHVFALEEACSKS